jgi:hypothetical protein
MMQEQGNKKIKIEDDEEEDNNKMKLDEFVA